MSTPTFSVRALSASHDPLWGQGQSNFLTDLDAVAQTIQTRLLLLEGEWWTNLLEGLPVLQLMLGVGGSGKNSSAASLAIQSNIEGAPYVTSAGAVQTSYDPSTRGFVFSCQVETVFGTLTVSYTLPGNSAVLPV